MMETRNNCLRLKQWDYVWKNTQLRCVIACLISKCTGYTCAGMKLGLVIIPGFLSSLKHLFLFLLLCQNPFDAVWSVLTAEEIVEQAKRVHLRFQFMFHNFFVSYYYNINNLNTTLWDYYYYNFMTFFILHSGITENPPCLPLILTWLVSMCVIIIITQLNSFIQIKDLHASLICFLRVSYCIGWHMGNKRKGIIFQLAWILLLWYCV